MSHDTSSFTIQDHHFIQRGDEWIDVNAEKMSAARRVRVRFDSREYFELLIKHPKVLPLLGHTRHVQLAIDDTVYEIYE